MCAKQLVCLDLRLIFTVLVLGWHEVLELPPLEVRLGVGLPGDVVEGAVLNAVKCTCVKVWYDADVSVEVLRFCPSLDSLVERLYCQKLIVACDVRSVV